MKKVIRICNKHEYPFPTIYDYDAYSLCVRLCKWIINADKFKKELKNAMIMPGR